MSRMTRLGTAAPAGGGLAPPITAAADTPGGTSAANARPTATPAVGEGELDAGAPRLSEGAGDAPLDGFVPGRSRTATTSPKPAPATRTATEPARQRTGARRTLIVRPRSSTGVLPTRIYRCELACSPPPPAWQSQADLGNLARTAARLSIH